MSLHAKSKVPYEELLNGSAVQSSEAVDIPSPMIADFKPLLDISIDQSNNKLPPASTVIYVVHKHQDYEPEKPSCCLTTAKVMAIVALFLGSFFVLPLSVPALALAFWGRSAKSHRWSLALSVLAIVCIVVVSLGIFFIALSTYYPFGYSPSYYTGYYPDWNTVDEAGPVIMPAEGPVDTHDILLHGEEQAVVMPAIVQ